MPIRSSILRGVAEMVDAAGGDGDGYVRSQGCSPEQILAGDTFLSYRKVAEILDDCARRFSIPDLGLRLAERQEPTILDELSLAMIHSRSLAEAIQSVSRYLSIYSPSIALYEVDDPEGDPHVTAFRYAVSPGAGAAFTQSIDYGVGIVHRFLIHVNGGSPYGLRGVHLPHPPLASSWAYGEFFGAAVMFEMPHTVLRADTAGLSATVPGGNPMIRKLAIEHLEARFGDLRPPMSRLASAAIVDQLGAIDVDLAAVAVALDLHPRALQRLLAAEGTTLTRLLDEVRRERAVHLITETELPFAQVAIRLGMREQSSLTRAVRRWFQTTPSKLRSSPHP